MGLDDNGDLGFQQRVGILPYSGTHMVSRPEKVAQETTMSPFSMCRSSNGVDSLYVTCWDPLVSLSQNLEFKSSSMDSHHQAAISSFNSDVMESQGISSSSHLVQYSSSPNLVEQAPNFPCFGNGSFSEMLSSLCLPDCDQIANAEGFPDYPSNKKGTKKTTNSPKLIDQGVIFQGDLTASSEGVRRVAPNGKKRKRVPENRAGDIHSQFDSVQCVDKEQLKDVSMEPIEGLKGQDEKKPKNNQNLVSNMCGKLNTKQIKDSLKNGQAPKEDYFHVRARHGQATNSHSLAERVRREKISERMRLLQDLVPGCDKINGKALMLEEIINYVQTLQRQVEFLSMKLATVNPELNIDIERILRRDIFHSHGGGSSASASLGFNPEMSFAHSQSHPHLTPQAKIHVIQTTDPNLPPMSQLPTSVWNDELGSVFQMGLVSNTALSSSELSGHMKVEL